MDAAARWGAEIRAATALTEKGRWEEAGATWQALARTSAQVGDLAVADHAARTGADAWRRADRPTRAAELLARVLDAGRATCADAALLAGCLLDAGAAEPAVAAAERAVRLASDEGQAVLARDTRLGARLATGAVASAAEDHAWLCASGLPAAGWSAAFRGAQLARLAGDLPRALAAWERLARQLGKAPAAAGALAGILQEQGETHLLHARLCTVAGEERAAREAAREATTCFEAAGRSSALAQRRAGLLRAEAWAALARARTGRAAILPRGDEMVAWAEGAGLAPLQAELRATLAELRHERAQDEAAVALLDGFPLARARVRLRAALGRRWPLDDGERERLARELSADAPWAGLLAACR